jgi:hypothetical protein
MAREQLVREISFAARTEPLIECRRQPMVGTPSSIAASMAQRPLPESDILSAKCDSSGSSIKAVLVRSSSQDTAAGCRHRHNGCSLAQVPWRGEYRRCSRNWLPAITMSPRSRWGRTLAMVSSTTPTGTIARPFAVSHRIVEVMIRRARIAREQRCSGDDLARLAVAALNRPSEPVTGIGRAIKHDDADPEVGIGDAMMPGPRRGVFREALRFLKNARSFPRSRLPVRMQELSAMWHENLHNSHRYPLLATSSAIPFRPRNHHKRESRFLVNWVDQAPECAIRSLL